MRKYLLVIAVMMLSISSFSQGITFFKGSYEQAQTLAKKEGKKIFIDVYTSWCGPCKKMSAEVFTDKAVGEFYNKNFVCMKIDAEKEASNDFFKSYKASSYPSYFWVDEKGELLDKQGGSCSVEVFISYGAKALKSNLGAANAKLKTRWDGGERSFELINNYVLEVMSEKDPRAVRPALIEFIGGLSPEQRKSKDCYDLVKGSINVRGRGGIQKDILLETFVSNFDHYESYNSKYDISIPSIYSIMYSNFVRVNTADYMDVKADIAETDKKIADNFNNLRSLGIKYTEIFAKCADAEKLLYTKKYDEGIVVVEKVLNEYGEQNPYLYSQLLYSILLSDYYLEGNKVKIDTVINIAKKALTVNPCKQNVFYYAVAQNANGNTVDAISALANMHFYKGGSASNAIYSKAGIRNIRKEFPDTNVK